MNIRALAVILLVLWGNYLLQAQPHYFNHYQVEEGLSNNAVISSLQDRQGFLWFGTKDGLNRFDGYTFKIFRNDDSDSTSIGSNFIYCLFEDKSGVLWIGSDRGLFRYEAATESFHPLKGAPATEIMDIQEDAEGWLWFISRSRLYRYNTHTQKVMGFSQSVPVPSTSICTTSRGGLWIATAFGQVGEYNTLTDSFTLYQVLDPAIPVGARWIEKIYDAGDSLLFIGTAKYGVRVFDTRTKSSKPLRRHDDKTDIFVRDILYHQDDEYWIATESGIFIYHARTGQWKNLKKSYHDPYSLSDNAVYTLSKDREGGIWAGTYFGGVNYYTKQNTLFKKFFPHNGPYAISGNAVREITQDSNGNLWIGTEDAGLNMLHPATGMFTHFGEGREKGQLSHSNIHGLLMNGQELWIGTFHHGLDVLDVRTGRVKRHYSAARDSLASDFVYCLYRTRSGTILAGTYRGLSAYNPNSDLFYRVRDIPGTFYTTLYEDRRGMLWAGTYSEGVYFFNPKTGEKGHYRNRPGDRHSLSGNRVNQVFEDSQSTLWIATEGGLSRLHRETGRFTSYTTRNGFPSNIIYHVLQDDRQAFWISTSRGLVRFLPATGRLTTYTRANGLLSDQFNYNSAFKDQHGRMYFGSGKGLIAFDPAEFGDNIFQPPVYITGLQVSNKELEINKPGSPLDRSVTFTRHLKLPHDQSSFSIDFAALSYAAPGMTEYAYKMEGLDNEWTFLKTNRKVYFTELAPGTYTFMVKASLHNGTWSRNPAMLTIEILPPFWKSWWAYLLYATIGIITVISGVMLYHQRTQEKNLRRIALLDLEKEKEIYQAKLDFFTNVAHEIRTPLTLIKGPMEKIMKRVEEVPSIRSNLQIMQRNTERLLSLTTQLLDFRKIEIHGAHLEFEVTNVSGILKDNYLRFKPMADQKRLSFILNAPTNLEASVDPEALDKILSNLLNNAIKYAQKQVHIHLQPPGKGDAFYIEVSNDGFLIPYDMKDRIFETFFRMKETEKISGTGIGLALSRSLAELHKGKLELMPPDGSLNSFRLTLPVQQHRQPILQPIKNNS